MKNQKIIEGVYSKSMIVVKQGRGKSFFLGGFKSSLKSFHFADHLVKKNLNDLKT